MDQQTGYLFLLQRFALPASQCRLLLRSCIRADWEQTLFHLWFPAQTPSVHHYTEQQLYINKNMSVPEERHGMKPNMKWEEGGEKDQKSPHGTG